MPRFSAHAAGRKAAAAQRKRLLTQAFCRHSIQYEGAPAPSYSPCKKELLSFKQGIFDKLERTAGRQSVRSFCFGKVNPRLCRGAKRAYSDEKSKQEKVPEL